MFFDQLFQRESQLDENGLIIVKNAPLSFIIKNIKR